MAHTSHILVATDLSDASKIALQRTAQIVGDTHGDAQPRVTLIHAFDPLGASPMGVLASLRNVEETIARELRANAAKQLEQLRQTELATVESVDVVALEHSNAVEALCDYARDHGVDLVVVGAQGRTGLSRILIGSVAERIARQAPCSVLVAR